MIKRLSLIFMVLTVCCSTPAIEQHHGIIVGTVLKLDAAASTLLVKVVDGTEHTFHFVKQTAVHGAQETATGAKDAFHGLKEGSEVAVHYTAKGTDETADEIDNIGKDGLKVSEGAITKFDRGTRTLTVKAADGTEQTFELTKRASEDAAKNTEDAAKKSAHATVYYSDAAGHKIAHYFKVIV